MTQEKQPTCQIVRPGGTYEGKQAFTYFAGISAESTGSKALCMHLLTIPPNGRAKAHLHENHETAIYVIEGEGCMWYGENLAEHMVIKAGEYLYIPAGVPHLPYNPSDSQSCTAVFGRTIAPEGITARNPAFDVTPHCYVTGIVTEEGIVYPPFTKNLRRAVEAAQEKTP